MHGSLGVLTYLWKHSRIGFANSHLAGLGLWYITIQNPSVCLSVCVWVLTRVVQTVTAACRGLLSCMGIWTPTLENSFQALPWTFYGWNINSPENLHPDCKWTFQLEKFHSPENCTLQIFLWTYPHEKLTSRNPLTKTCRIFFLETPLTFSAAISALTLLFSSFDLWKPVSDMTCDVFGGTLNLDQSMLSNNNNNKYWWLRW